VVADHLNEIPSLLRRTSLQLNSVSSRPSHGKLQAVDVNDEYIVVAEYGENIPQVRVFKRV
jgi:hypothetical protein